MLGFTEVPSYQVVNMLPKAPYNCLLFVTKEIDISIYDQKNLLAIRDYLFYHLAFPYDCFLRFGVFMMLVIRTVDLVDNSIGVQYGRKVRYCVISRGHSAYSYCVRKYFPMVQFPLA